MKKLIALVLCLSMGLSLCACFWDKPGKEYDHITQMLEDGDYPGAVEAIKQLPGYPAEAPAPVYTPTEPGVNGSEKEPTAEEHALLEAYASILQDLHNENIRYWEDGKYLYGSAALGKFYAQLQEMAAIDEWLKNPDDPAVSYYFNSDYFCDRQTLMSRFTIVEDVYLGYIKTYEDNMGNISTSDCRGMELYDAAGILVESIVGEYPVLEPEGLLNGWIISFDRDDAGRILTKTLKSGNGSVLAILTYTYDDLGRIRSAHWKENDGENDFDYVYDEAGNLTTVSGTHSDSQHVFTYSYNEAGQQTKAVYHRNGKLRCTFSLEYDGSGNLVSGLWEAPNPEILTYYGEFFHYFIGEHSFSVDSAGRVIRQEILPRSDYYVRITYEYIYGDYYTYNA